MFPFGLLFGTLAVLPVSLALALCGVITAGAFVWTWLLAPFAVLALLMIRDPDAAMRRVGASILAVVALGVALAVHVTPAHASAAADLVWHGPGFTGDLVSLPADAIAAPPGDTGLWAGLNAYLAEGLGAVVAAVATWAFKEIATHTRIRIRADQEAQIRETALTGVYGAMHDLELEIDQHWTPAERQTVVDRATTWVQIRAEGQLARLGLPDFVTRAIVTKVLGQVMGATFDTGELPITGNPGETPALDRAATGGA